MSRSEPADASPPEPGVGFLLKRAQHAYRTRIDLDLRSLGITAPQYAVLLAVAADPGVSNAQLSRAAFVTPQSMQSMIANMERLGLLSRTPDMRRRGMLATELTPKGAMNLALARERVASVEELMALKPSEQAALKAMLAELAERLST